MFLLYRKAVYSFYYTKVHDWKGTVCVQVDKSTLFYRLRDRLF